MTTYNVKIFNKHRIFPPQWEKFKNHLRDQYSKSTTVEWNMELLPYSAILDLDDEGDWIVTFKDEKDYVVFLLRWA